MTRFTFPALIAAVMFLLPESAAVQARRFSLESVDGLTLHNVAAEPAALQGKKGVRLTLSAEARERLKKLEALKPEEQEKNMTPEELARGRRSLPLFEQLAVVRDLEFSNGVIEIEVAGAPEAGAADTARGFVGVAFRLQKADTYDSFYLRPTNGRADDQLRRNHTVQYMSHPEWPWPRLRKETPGVYESYVDIVPGEWTKMRIEVRGDKARLYVHDAKQPTLIVNDVKSGAGAKGALALWLGPGTVAHFRALTVTPAPREN